MRDFKIGDWVIRTSSTFEGMKIGDIGMVTEIWRFGAGVKIDGYGKYFHDGQNLELYSVEEEEN